MNSREERMPGSEPVEFSFEDAVLNTWVEDTGLYLCLDIAESLPDDASPANPES